MRPGEAWIARGDHHLTLSREGMQVKMRLTQQPPENSCRPSVDVLFRSAAEVYGRNLLGVVLTGMGQDGLLGARKLRLAGADIMVQDEASSVVWGMPGYIAREGLADAVLPLPQIAPEMARRLCEAAAALRPTGVDGRSRRGPAQPCVRLLGV